MTEDQRKRAIKDFTEYSGGEQPVEFLYYGPEFTVAFKSELAALRTANRYATPHRVQYSPGIDAWLCRVG